MNLKKTVILLVIAAILSGIGVYFAYNYIQQAVKDQKQIQPLHREKEKVETRLLVGLPQRTLQGTLITAEHIKAMTVPITTIFDGDYINWEDRNEILGHRLLVSLPSHSGLQYSDLINSANMLFSDQLDPGERAMTIAVDPLNSHFGFLQPKDHIDLLLVVNQSEPLTRHLLSNIEVLATDMLVETDLSQPQIPNSGQIHTLTLKVTIREAQTLALAKTQGSLTILLRNQKDSISKNEASFNNHMLFPRKKSVELIVGNSQ